MTVAQPLVPAPDGADLVSAVATELSPSVVALRALIGSLAAMDARLTHISITTFDGARVEVLLATTELARGMARAQGELGRGALVEATRTGLPVIVTASQRARRLPRLVAAAQHWGVDVQLAVPLNRESPVGAVSVYGGPGAAVDRSLVDVAERLATLADAILSERRFTSDLQAALVTRERIGQACGILMSRHLLTADDAMTALRRGSQHRNVKLRELAREVVETGSLSELEVRGNAPA